MNDISQTEQMEPPASIMPHADDKSSSSNDVKAEIEEKHEKSQPDDNDDGLPPPIEDLADAINLDELVSTDDIGTQPVNLAGNESGGVISNWWQSISSTIRTLSALALDENEPAYTSDSLLSFTDSTSPLFPGLYPSNELSSPSAEPTSLSSSASSLPSTSASSPTDGGSNKWPLSLRSLLPLTLTQSASPAPQSQQTSLIGSPTSSAIPSSPVFSADPDDTSSTVQKRKSYFDRILDENPISLERLQKISWSGIPDELRPQVWKVLLGYAPLHHGRRQEVIQKKRLEYFNYLKHYAHHFTLSNTENGMENSEPTMQNNNDNSSQANSSSTSNPTVPQIERAEGQLLRQILVDIPRTSPTLAYFRCKSVQKSFERVLFIYGARHPATNYVQGMNDILCTFYGVFIQEYCNIDVQTTEDCPLTHEQRLSVEADCFWCFSALLEKITDHYTFAQPGIQKMIFSISSLIATLDPYLYDHLQKQDVSFLHFAFRWMNCLLIRELPLPCCIRLFDTYFACHDLAFAVSEFHVYACAALLISFSSVIKEKEFSDILLFLQKLPTDDWKVKQIDSLIAQAYVYQQRKGSQISPDSVTNNPV